MCAGKCHRSSMVLTQLMEREDVLKRQKAFYPGQRPIPYTTNRNRKKEEEEEQEQKEEEGEEEGQGKQAKVWKQRADAGMEYEELASLSLSCFIPLSFLLRSLFLPLPLPLFFLFFFF